MTPTSTVQDVRRSLLERREVALLDVREEAAYAEGHPLFAASLPLGRLELEVWDRIPRRGVPVVVYDDGEGLALPAVRRLEAMGYTDVSLLEGGLAGWRAAGAELFRDVNVPSKAFGELVEARRHTPSIAPQELDSWLREGRDIVVLDARRFEEYHTMSIPGGISVPGGELVLRVADLAPDPGTVVVVNCAGRTRSIIGTQSLVNAGIPNRVAALRNGTIGWTLAGYPLDRHAGRRPGSVSAEAEARAKAAARQVAERAGVGRVHSNQLRQWALDEGRTVYRFDVRTPEEYAAGHLPGFRSAPGGQLVQETDVFAPVRGARIVLADDSGVRAWMAGSWLRQMGWEVFVLDAPWIGDGLETGFPSARLPPLPAVDSIDAAELRARIDRGGVTVVDFAKSPVYSKGHLPGAAFVMRSRLGDVCRLVDGPDANDVASSSGHGGVAAARAVVFTSPDAVLATLAAAEFEASLRRPVQVLAGGTCAWSARGFPLEVGTERWLSPPADVYRRPYEGTDNPRQAMQAYLDWEYGLVAQLERDATHHFFVV